MIQALQDALAERGYDNLTEVQEAVTAPGLEHADLLVSAQTGSGKTVGFGLAIAPTLLEGAEFLGQPGAPLALIVAPTRELALQVARELQWLYAKTGARVTTCVGGMDPRDERRALERGTHVVVGTPGRLTDHIRRGALDLSAIRAVVLDEADEMLDLGFREDLEFMLDAAPEERRTLLFSATVPAAIAKLAKTYQRDAQRVTTTSGASQHADITYQAMQVAERETDHAIFNLLRFHDAQNAIVFANTRAAVNHLAARLTNRNLAVVSLSGELSQTERSHALQAMRDGRARVCVATDVAARGIDLPNLDLVIHADLPSNSETLLHRSGRTGRAGRKGISALIVTPRIGKKAERLLGWADISAEWIDPPSAEDVLRRDRERLLADPAWTQEPSDEEQAFAADLVAAHAPEAIAAAYLRLYRARHAAPEDLTPPGTRPEKPKREPRAFGPGVWFALTTGRNDRAEARWLLPLLCRAGDITKSEIGAIRIQNDVTYVELLADCVPGFLSHLPDGETLQEGLTMRRLDSPPDLGKPAPRGPSRGPREGGKPMKRGPKPGGAKFGGPKPSGPKPYGDKPHGKAPFKPKDRPASQEASAPERAERKPRHKADAAPAPAPQSARADADAPRKPRAAKPAPRKPAGDKPAGDKPGGAKYAGPRPGAESASVSLRRGGPGKGGAGKGGKPGGGFKGKPGGKPGGPKGRQGGSQPPKRRG